MILFYDKEAENSDNQLHALLFGYTDLPLFSLQFKTKTKKLWWQGGKGCYGRQALRVSRNSLVFFWLFSPLQLSLGYLKIIYNVLMWAI